MYSLNKVGEKTYYLDSPTNIGLYKLNDNDVCIIDSGNDKEAGRKINKILKENKFNLAYIINTHSNADHIGGNEFLQKRTDCKIISTEIENLFAKYPILEPSFLYGGYPLKKLTNKFLMAKASNPTSDISELPEGLEYIKLGGHFFDMIGIKTSDDVYFLADCVFGQNTINKYHLSFIYNVEEFLKTLDFVETLEGKLFIPSHAEPCEDIKPLVKLNRDKVFEIIDTILNICKKPLIFEDILQKLFIHYDLKMDLNQYVLVGNTLKAYLSYLHDNEKLSLEILDAKLYWKTI
ncbi:MAG: MBL fold metallo-hydrolase [Intestinibacter sp.]